MGRSMQAAMDHRMGNRRSTCPFSSGGRRAFAVATMGGRESIILVVRAEVQRQKGDDTNHDTLPLLSNVSVYSSPFGETRGREICQCIPRDHTPTRTGNTNEYQRAAMTTTNVLRIIPDSYWTQRTSAISRLAILSYFVPHNNHSTRCEPC